MDDPTRLVRQANACSFRMAFCWHVAEGVWVSIAVLGLIAPSLYLAASLLMIVDSQMLFSAVAGRCVIID